METYSIMVHMASGIIVGGFFGIMIAVIADGIKAAIRKHRKKKEDTSNDLHE